MQIITRQEAIKQGLDKYYVLTPCKKGHVTPRSVKRKRCPICEKKGKMKWQREAKAVRRSITLRSYRKNLEYSREYSVVKRGNLKAKALGQICRVSLQEWRDLKAKYNNQCLKCLRSEPEVKVSMDHVIPLSQGGLHHIDNIQPLCISCNTSKMIKSTDYRKTYSA